MGLAVTKQEAFWEACGFGHAQKVEDFIKEGVDVNWVSYTHNSCAIHVASQGKPEIVKMLLVAKCNVNALDDRGNIAIHHAAMKGHTDIMQMLIDSGSEIDTQDKNGWSPLFNAAYWCQPEAIAVLIKNNCNTNLKNKDERTALHEVCRSPSRDEEGLAQAARLLAQGGCDVNLKGSDIGMVDFTPLMFASYHGHLNCVEALVEAKCDLNAQASNDWSALHWATDRGRRDIVKLLLDAGVDPLLRGQRGELAVQRAKDNEIREMLAAVSGLPEGDKEAAARWGLTPGDPLRDTPAPAKVDTRKKVSEMLSNGMTPSRSVIRKRTHPRDVSLFAPQAPASSSIPSEEGAATPDGDSNAAPALGTSVLEGAFDFIDGEDEGEGEEDSATASALTSVSEKDQKEALEKQLDAVDLNDDLNACDILDGKEDFVDDNDDVAVARKTALREPAAMATPPTAGVEDMNDDVISDAEDESEAEVKPEVKREVKPEVELSTRERESVSTDSDSTSTAKDQPQLAGSEVSTPESAPPREIDSSCSEDQTSADV